MNRCPITRLAIRTAELRERLRLDLADALAGDAELPAHFFERAYSICTPRPELCEPARAIWPQAGRTTIARRRAFLRRRKLFRGDY